MESTRQAKIARLLQKELSEIFRQQTAKTQDRKSTRLNSSH